MFKHEIIKNPSFDIKDEILKDILKRIGVEIKKEQFWTLNIVFVNWNEIKDLNRTYRNIDKETDVLSFHYFEDFSSLKDDETAWELVFCEEKIKSQAIEYWLWEEKEFYKLFIHSVLHILWYDHEEDKDYEIMQELEDILWKQIFGK